MADDQTRKDFFISYNRHDRAWAEWIAQQLEDAGYSTIIQAWDFAPGMNFPLKMHEALKSTRRTLLMLSPTFLTSEYTAPEWAGTFVKEPQGMEALLVPVRVRACKPDGLLAALAYIDLVDLNEADARRELLDGVRPHLRPSQPLSFPGMPSQQTQTLSFPGTWPEVWHVPYQRNLLFTGREERLHLLHDQLSTSQTSALTQPQRQAISGLGGIGKTQTALEYAYRYGSQYRYVLWVSAATAEMLSSEFAALAAVLSIPGQGAREQQVVIESVKHWLEQHQDWLLILDNADDLEEARKYFPGGTSSNGYLLLTTRAHTAGPAAQTIEIDTMGQEEATLFLLHRAGILAREASLTQAKPKDRAEAEAIAAELDGLPLALDQAGAYIDETSCSLTDYLLMYKQQRSYLLAQRGQHTPGHPETVATTWNFHKVEEVSRASAELLHLCAFLAPDAIPEELLTQGASELGSVLKPVAANPVKLNEALKILLNYSLIKRNRETKTLSLHRLVQVVLRDDMNEPTARRWAERTVRAVNLAFPNMTDVALWERCERYLPHALVCATLIEKYSFEFAEASLLLNQMAYYLYRRAQYFQAEPLLQRALAIREKQLGPRHPDTATSLNNLAELYRAQGKYAEAEPLYQRALAIAEQRLGPEHPATVTIRENYHALVEDMKRKGKELH